MARENLKEARRAAGLTQEKMAEKLDITLRYYQKIESGDRTGDFAIWDTLEDITGIHQRKLREIKKCVKNTHVNIDKCVKGVYNYNQKGGNL